MRTRIVFHPDAVTDAGDATRWYRQRSERAAARFVDELERVLREISSAPRRHALDPLGVRKAPLRHFPYSVVYRYADIVEIIAVAHGRRAPGFWSNR